MTCDASYKTQDMLILNEMSTDVFNFDSVRNYRMRMKNLRPGHVWEALEDLEFLYRLGAADKGEDGNLHPRLLNKTHYCHLVRIGRIN